MSSSAWGDRRSLNASSSPSVWPEGRVNFGPFSLRQHGSALYRNEEQVRLGSRALHILVVLTARAGEVVSKADIIAEVWPNVTVAENNLTVHVSALRQALSDGQDGVRYIINVPGRGYSFVAPIDLETDGKAAEVSPTPSRVTNLPRLLRPVIGLSEPIASVITKLDSARLVTVVGPAGVGKTTLALYVGQTVLSRHVEGVWLIELAPLREANHIVPAIATAMRIELGPGDPTTTLLAVLSRTNALLLLDNSEHLIEPIAGLAARILQHCPNVSLLATSREPLRVSGEAIYSLAPLEAPPNAKKLTADEALAYPAVQLFVEQAGAALNDFTLYDKDAVSAALICRRLDGLPLAIELASPLVATFGVKGLAARLDDRFRLTQIGMRGAPDRHRTLTTALEWSYGLLADREQLVLRRLAIFVGTFTLEGAAAVVGVEDAGELAVLLANLHAKSLVTRFNSTANLRFLLLETTRAFALEKLRQSDETEQLASRHAVFYADMLEFAWNNKARLFEQGAYADIADQLGNVRSALQWRFSAADDSPLAIALAAGAAFFFIELGLIIETLDWATRALAVLDETQRNTRHEMMLRYAYAYAYVITHGNTDDSDRAAKKSIELATLLKDHDVLIRILTGYHMYVSRSGDVKAAMQIARRAAAVAEEAEDPDANAMAQALLSHSYHYAGDQTRAEACISAVLSRLPLERRWNSARFGNDQRVRVLACRASILWLMGRVTQARTVVGEFLTFSERVGDPILAVQAAYAASIFALQCGDWSWASDLIGRLKDVALEYAIAPFPILATALESELMFRTGSNSMRERFSKMQERFEAVRVSRYNLAYHGLALIEGYIQLGFPTSAKQLLDTLVMDMNEKGQLLYMPEYLRLEGDIVAADAKPQPDLVEAAYWRAFELARKQSALAWELRAAVSLARIYAPEHPGRATSVLRPVYQRFGEGLGTADLVSAKQLLDDLASRQLR